MNNQRCNLCGKILDEWDLRQNFKIFKILHNFIPATPDSKYDGMTLDLSSCIRCADIIVDLLRERCANDPITDNGLL